MELSFIHLLLHSFNAFIIILIFLLPFIRAESFLIIKDDFHQNMYINNTSPTNIVPKIVCQKVMHFLE